MFRDVFKPAGSGEEIITTTATNNADNVRFAAFTRQLG